MTNIEQEARDRLNKAARDGEFWGASDTRKRSPSVEVVCGLLEEFAAFKQDVSDRAERASVEACKYGDAATRAPAVVEILKPLIIDKPDPLYDSVRAALPGSMPDHHAKAIAKNLATELAKHGGKIVFEGEG